MVTEKLADTENPNATSKPSTETGAAWKQIKPGDKSMTHRYIHSWYIKSTEQDGERIHVEANRHPSPPRQSTGKKVLPGQEPWLDS